jgi:hypothetical protein
MKQIAVAYAKPVRHRLEWFILCAVSTVLTSMAVSMAQEPVIEAPFPTPEELRETVSELVTLVESRHDCQFTIDGGPWLERPFEMAFVVFAAKGERCREAIDELRNRGWAAKIIVSVPEVELSVPKVERPPRPPPRNDDLTLLHEVVE